MLDITRIACYDIGKEKPTDVKGWFIMTATIIRISRRPTHPQSICVLFDDEKKAKEFIDEVINDFEFEIDSIKKDDRKKYAYLAQVYENLTLLEIKKREHGTGAYGAYCSMKG